MTTSLQFFRTIISIVTFLFAGIVLNVTQVFGFILVLFCNLGGVNLSSWVTLTTSLVAFVFLGGLDLDLRLTCINRREIVGLSLVLILILPIGFIFVLSDWSVVLWVLKVDLPCT